jgi:hypothetical protein
MKLWAILGMILLSPFRFGNAYPTVFVQSSQEASVAPDGRTHNEVDGIFITQEANEPFSAKQLCEWTRSLADGTIVTSKYYTIIARDSQGRVYRENRKIVPANSDVDSPLNYSFVLDPDAATRTECHPSTQVCRVTSYRPVRMLRPNTTESVALGNDTMESLDVIGTRETLTVQAGAIGNDHDFVVTKEIWYSPRLQINLSVVRNDPRIGKQTFKITQINLGEPDPKFFGVPAGYRVVDERKGSE